MNAAVGLMLAFTAFAGVVGLWDYWIYRTRGRKATISDQFFLMWRQGKAVVIVFFFLLLGMLLGGLIVHFFALEVQP